MSENIKFKKNHFTLVEGYFYMFDDDTNVLYQRTADSVTSFSYPLDTLLNSEVYSLEHDGANFWTLEQSGEESLIIKRWALEKKRFPIKNSLWEKLKPLKKVWALEKIKLKPMKRKWDIKGMKKILKKIKDTRAEKPEN